jgi:flavin-binding protein dodecin
MVPSVLSCAAQNAIAECADTMSHRLDVLDVPDVSPSLHRMHHVTVPTPSRGFHCSAG